MPTYQEAALQDQFLTPEDYLAQNDPANWLAQNEPKLTDPFAIPEDLDAEGKLKFLAVGLAAGFITYRFIVKERLAAEEPRTRKEAAAVVAKTLNATRGLWLKNATPYLAQAMRVRTDELSVADATAIATAYADSLGDQLNEVSAEALLDGFEQQLATNAPPGTAWSRATSGYGLETRRMRQYLKLLSQAGNVQTKAVVSFVDKALMSRATRIGDNETFTASQTGKSIAWMLAEKQGVIPRGSKKRWVTAEDELVCPTCAAMHNAEADLDSQFVTDEGAAWAPEVHPGCRCEMDLVYPEDDEITKAYRGGAWQPDDHWREQTRGNNGRWVPMNRQPQLQTKTKPQPFRFSYGDEDLSEEGARIRQALLDAPVQDTDVATGQMLAQIADIQDELSSGVQLEDLVSAPTKKTISLEELVKRQSTEALQKRADAAQQARVNVALYHAAAQKLATETPVQAPAPVQAPVQTKTELAKPTGLVLHADAIFGLSEEANAYRITPSNMPQLAHMPRSGQDVMIGDEINFDDAADVQAALDLAYIDAIEAAEGPGMSEEDKAAAIRIAMMERHLTNREEDYLSFGRSVFEEEGYLDPRFYADAMGNGITFSDLVNAKESQVRDELHEREVGYYGDYDANYWYTGDSTYYKDREDYFEDRKRSWGELRSDMREELEDQVGTGAVSGLIRGMDPDEIVEIYEQAGMEPPTEDIRSQFAEDLAESMETNQRLIGRMDDWNFDQHGADYADTHGDYGLLSSYIDTPSEKTLRNSTEYFFTFPEGVNAESEESWDGKYGLYVKGSYRVADIGEMPTYDSDTGNVTRIVTIALKPNED